MAIGMFTPPFGLNLIVASSVTKMPMEKLLPGCIPFFIVSLIALFLITYVEPISMWLPNLIY
jgi:C4-dicarboxylate transporter DctM subunit